MDFERNIIDQQPGEEISCCRQQVFELKEDVMKDWLISDHDQLQDQGSVSVE